MLQHCFRCPAALISRAYFNINELNRWRLSRLMLNYCAKMHRRRCRTARRTQEQLSYDRQTAFHSCIVAQHTFGYRRRPHEKREDVYFPRLPPRSAEQLMYLQEIGKSNTRLYCFVLRWPFSVHDEAHNKRSRQLYCLTVKTNSTTWLLNNKLSMTERSRFQKSTSG